LYEEYLSRGAEIDVELGDRDFGLRDFRVDRSGNVLGFAEATQASPPLEETGSHRRRV
jgi:hypothetical protein